jgi:hypothetical protein
MTDAESRTQQSSAGQHTQGRAGGAGRSDPFPDRPALTTPDELQDHAVVRAERRQVAAQPMVGLIGILFAVAVFVVLVYGAGDVESSLEIFGPMATFALPPIAMIAFWWNDWPGTRVRAPWSGLIDTVLVVVLAIVLTMAGEAIVERFDVSSIFRARPGPDHPTTFPATLPLAGAAFAAMLQLTLVSEGWPLRRLGRIRSGVVALVVAWAVAVVAYLLVVNTDSVPAAERADAGLRNPGGPVSAPDFGGMLIAIGLWQAVFFIGVRGWPFAGIPSRPVRLVAGNVVVIGLGLATFFGLRNLAGWSPGLANAVCGCVISAVLVIAMLFEGWPGTMLRPLPGRLIDLGLIALVAAALYFGLTSLARNVSWVKATPDDWVTTAALTFFGAGIILHVAIGRRWPLSRVAGAGEPGTVEDSPATSRTTDQR